MAYSIVKEQTGNTAIVINGWTSGTSADPYSGIGRMLTSNLSVPGEVSSGYPLTANIIGAGTLGIPIHRAIKEAGGVATAYFILDASSQVWSSSTYSGTFSFLSTSNSTTGATATNQGLVYWIPRSGGTGYLFKFRNDKIDYLAAGAGTWQTGWQTITANVNHFAIASQDGAVYFCNGASVGSILELDGQTFDPTNSATYSFTTAAVPIAPYDRAQSLAEQGTQLLIGGSLNAIYPWDRISVQPNYPIFIGDTFIDRMVTVNTNVYIFPGGVNSRGRIYVTNGTQANLFFKIPDYITGVQDPYFTWGDAIFHRNNLIFSFFMKKNSGAFVDADPSFGSTSQVWSVDLSINIYGSPTESGFRSLSQIDAPSTIGRANVIMPALQSSPGMSYIIGYEDSQGGNTSGIEYSGTNSGIGRFTVNTDLMPVGTLFDKRTFTQVEFKLRSALQSGESFSIVPIVDGVSQNALTDSTVGDISFVYPVNFEKAQWLNFLVQGIGNSQTSGVRLYEVRVR